MSPHPFLSPEWIDAARLLRDEYRDRVPPATIVIRANVVVRDPPFGDEAVRGHVDTTAGIVIVEEGHLDEADLLVELAYELAHRLFVERDAQAAMQALFAGQIRVTGDSSKLLAIQPPPPNAVRDPLVAELAARIDEITA